MLSAFFDDSGTFPQNEVFVLGGYVSPLNRWSGFRRRWREALREAPSIEYFKAFEAHHLLGEFDRSKRWDETKRDEKVARLCGVIGAHADCSLHVGVPRDEFMAGTQHLPRRFRDPFYMGYRLLLDGVPALGSYRPYGAGRMLMVFDRQKDGLANAVAKELFRPAIHERQKKWLQDVVEGDDRGNEVELQSADLLAFRNRRVLSRQYWEFDATRYSGVGEIPVVDAPLAQPPQIRAYVRDVESRRDLW